MIHECIRTQIGIQFRRNVLEDLGINAWTHDPRLQAPSPPSVACLTEAPPLATKEEEEERADALSRMHDQLKEVKAWWMLEWLPLRHRRQYKEYSRPRHYWSYVACGSHLAAFGR